MGKSAVVAIDAAAGGGGVLESPIMAWEVGMLCWRERSPFEFLRDSRAWFADLLSLPGVREAPFHHRIALGSSYLPGVLHPDPGDRLIVATARKLDVPVVTRDRRILDHAAAGHVAAVTC